MDSSKFIQFYCVYAQPDTVTFYDVSGSCGLAGFLSSPVFQAESPGSFRTWCASGMAKTVRRVSKESTYRKLFELPFAKKRYDYVSQLGFRYSVLVFEPIRYGDSPRLLQRLRVNGFDDCLQYPKTLVSREDDTPAVYVLNNEGPLTFSQVLVIAMNPQTDMPAGKFAIQAAHAGVKAYCDLSSDPQTSCIDYSDFVCVADVDSQWFYDYDKLVTGNELTGMKKDVSTCSYGWEFYSDDDELDDTEREGDEDCAD